MSSLKNKRVIVTRALAQAGAFVQLLTERGATALVIPTIEIVPPPSWEDVDRAIAAIDEYQWLFLTSANGASFFFNRLRETRGGLEALAALKICAIGPRTRDAITGEGLEVDFMPTKYVAEAFIEQAREQPWKGQKILLPRAEEARDIVPDEMRRLGAHIDAVTVYRTIRPPVSEQEFRRVLAAGEADAITFTSSSTVKNFMSLFPGGEGAELLKHVAVAVIGPVTADSARSMGMTVDVMPGDYTVSALTAALEGYFSGQKEG